MITTTALTKNKLTTYSEALEIIRRAAGSFGKERVGIEEADGRILAENILADRDYPPFNRAAMDGFAISSADWDQGLRSFQVMETVLAGDVHSLALVKGSCYKIMTGAAVPPAADLLIRREEALEYDGAVIFTTETVKPYQNIVPRGEDVKANEMVLPMHTRCSPSVLASLAAVGKDTIRVEKLPRVALFTTGNELVEVGKRVAPAQIRNSNKHLLLAQMRNWQIRPTICSHLADDPVVIARALQKALAHDIIIINGGVSAGDADHVPMVLESLGVDVQFHKVAIKPGKPILFGVLPKGGVVFALPGNPFSCMVTFTLFVNYYLYSCFGFKYQPVYQVPLVEQRQKTHGLTEFFPVRMDAFAAGVVPLAINGSGDIRAGLGAHGLGIHPANQEVLKRGANISFIPFGPAML